MAKMRETKRTKKVVSAAKTESVTTLSPEGYKITMCKPNKAPKLRTANC